MNLRESKVREVTLKVFLNLKRIFAPFAFYYLHNYLKYKTLLFIMHSVIFNHIFRGQSLDRGFLSCFKTKIYISQTIL